MLFITSLLVGAVFGIVNGVTQLTHDLTEQQKQEGEVHGFVELCSRTLRRLPPHAAVRLRTNQAGRHYLTELVFADVPSPLAATGGRITVLRTEEAVDGTLRVALVSLTEEDLPAWDSGDHSAGVRVVLLENLTLVEWRIHDPLSQQWLPVWNEHLSLTAWMEKEARVGSGGDNTQPAPEHQHGWSSTVEGERSTGDEPDRSMSHKTNSARPTRVELKFARGREAPQRWSFWVPPAVGG